MRIFIDTKEVLIDALRALLREKPFDDISVSNIIAKAKVSRATFYRHFQDKYSLMCWVYEAQVGEIVKNNPRPSQSINILTESARFMKENESYFSQIVKYHGQNSFMQFVSKYVYNITVNRIQEQTENGELSPEMIFAIKFHCGGIIYTINEWLETGLKEAPEKIGQMIFESMPEKLKPYLGQPRTKA